MKKLTTLLVAGLFSLALAAQSDPRIARTKAPLADVPLALMPQLDNGALLAAEMERRGPGIPPKFAEAMEVDISPTHSGRWEMLPNGNALWRLRIRSNGARSLNLGFSKYIMPARGSLILYSPDYETVIGPFTPADNEEHEQLWTPILPGEELVVEVQVPAFQQSALQLELKYVNHDFAGFAEIASGSCNLDVICGGADGWAIVDKYRDIIQSVAVMQYQGAFNCTGFLINNARQDCTPYFMTANHCGVTAGVAPTLVNYWNFQNSTCRQPNSPASGGNGNGPLNNFNTGSVLRATSSNSDFTLLELDDPVSPTANAFYAGWSAENFAPTDTVICIHHPNTDEKRISFEFQPTFVADYNSTTPNPNGTHLTVPDWDIGTTEGGSSGSPLFNREKQVVGQLHGGFAACGNDDLDSYGWFYRSWTGGGAANNSLKPWLDPDNTGINTLDGRAALQCSYYVEGSPASQSFCAPAEAVYNLNVSPNFTANVTLSVANLPAGLTATFGANPVAPGGTTTLTIGNTAGIADGNYNFALEGTDGSATTSSNLSFFVAAQIPAPPIAISPADGTGGYALSPIFTWTATPGVKYTLELASDAAFTNIIESASNLTAPSYHATTVLVATTAYFWRVRGENICGQGDWPTTPNSFATGAITCAPLVSENVPVNISASGTPTVTSTLTITGSGFVDDLNLNNLNIEHSWVSDLEVSLTSPSGTTVALFADAGNDDCRENDLLLSFDDEAAATYADFQGMCDTTPPALSGSFQPLTALSAFDGEPMAGTWTLTISDDFNQDGGALLGWGLDLCSTIPDDLSVSPSNNSQTSCLGANLAFNLSLGTAFDDASGVTLSATNLPAGATAIFSPNPAQPGSQVAVTVSGASTVGNFSFEVVGTDGLGNTGNATVQWTVLGIPAPPTATVPMPNATNVPLNTVLSWSGTGGGTVVLALDANLNNVLINAESQANAFSVGNLLPCTSYYWTATSSGQCGSSAPSAVFSFTTVDDLSFNASPTNVQLCPTGNANISLAIGDCFEAGGVMLSATGYPDGVTISFPQNPVPAGSTQQVALNLTNVIPGNYAMTLTGNDGMNNVAETFFLNVIAPSAAPVFVAPANATTGVNVLTAFDWNPVAGAANYNFQLATDANFTNMLADVTVGQTAYTVTSPLNLNTTYFWRVTAYNNCGGTTPAPYSFTTWIVNKVNELNGITVRALPNPTNGLLNLQFSKPTYEAMDASLFAVNGVLLKNQPVQIGSSSASFDLSGLPSGVYLLRLKSGSGVLTEKIVVE